MGWENNHDQELFHCNQFLYKLNPEGGKQGIHTMIALH